MSNYKWTKLFSIRGGHKYFRDEITKMIALADDSGSTPDQTDDGVLWLDFQRCVTIYTDPGHRTWISVPVLQEYRPGSPVRQSSTTASTREANEVCTRFGMKLSMGGGRFAMVRLESEVAEQSRHEHDAKQENDVQA
jgi:hypothetical protein